MSLFDILGGEFIEIIEWTDDSRDTMVYRFPTVGNAIKYGAKLTVREGQAAVFIHEGQLADVFGPGLYMLETNNLPILTRLTGLPRLPYHRKTHLGRRPNWPSWLTPFGSTKSLRLKPRLRSTSISTACS